MGNAGGTPAPLRALCVLQGMRSTRTSHQPCCAVFWAQGAKPGLPLHARTCIFRPAVLPLLFRF